MIEHDALDDTLRRRAQAEADLVAAILLPLSPRRRDEWVREYLPRTMMLLGERSLPSNRSAAIRGQYPGAASLVRAIAVRNSGD